ncbi:MAG: type II secretion system F family protein [Burkholderiales bacterium]|jgi:general secretion pathway protein F
MRFELVLVDERGTLARRSVEAASKAAARATLRPGEREIACKSAGVAFGRQASIGRGDRLAFCEALEQVLAGGLTLSESLRALSSDEGSGGAAVARALVLGLDAGLPPSQAFESSGLGWSPFLIALLRSGERTGQLPASLERFVRFERGLLEMRGRLISASVYPLVLGAVSLGVLGFLLGFVVPKFAASLDDLRTDLPAASRLVFDIGRWTGDHLGSIALGVVLVVIAALVAGSSPAIRAAVLAAFSRLPVARDVVTLAGRAQAMRVAAALLGGGATMSTALEVARRTSPAPTAARLERAAARVQEGAAPSLAMADAGLAGPVALQLIVAAERTGGLPACFERLATADEARLAKLLDRATTAWGPVLLLGVAAVVGCVVLALYWPMLQVFESIR